MLTGTAALPGCSRSKGGPWRLCNMEDLGLNVCANERASRRMHGNAGLLAGPTGSVS